MIFNSHYRLKGQHAFLSASKFHWLQYDPEKLEQSFYNHDAAERGSRLHFVASELIDLKHRQAKGKIAFNRYVNDAIGFKMKTEQVLYYSDNCFGTADAIGFRNNQLRIFDYKSGRSKTHFVQLEIYAALFCLEYDIDPKSLSLIELRIYQDEHESGQVPAIKIPEIDRIEFIMQKIVHDDKIIDRLKIGG